MDCFLDAQMYWFFASFTPLVKWAQFCWSFENEHYQLGKFFTLETWKISHWCPEFKIIDPDPLSVDLLGEKYIRYMPPCPPSLHPSHCVSTVNHKPHWWQPICFLMPTTWAWPRKKPGPFRRPIQSLWVSSCVQHALVIDQGEDSGCWARVEWTV